MQNGIDTRSGKNAEKIIEEYGRNFVIQEIIKPCDELHKLSPNCLSTMRVMTYITDNGVHTCPIALRVGTGNSDIDNIHAGGLVVAVEDDGKLGKYAYRLGYGDKAERFTKHPDSGVIFENYQLPMVPEIRNLAMKMHSRIPQCGILSWDFTIDSDNRVTLIELNTRDQSVWFPQMVSGKSLFGENTEYFLERLKRG